MPYDIRKTDDGYHVINQATGEDRGKSTTRQRAERHMEALVAAAPRRMSSPGMRAEGDGPVSAVDDTYTPRIVEKFYVGGKAYPVK